MFYPDVDKSFSLLELNVSPTVQYKPGHYHKALDFKLESNEVGFSITVGQSFSMVYFFQ